MKSRKFFIGWALLIILICPKAFFSCMAGNPSEEEYKTTISGTLSQGAGGAPHLQNEPVSRPAHAPLAGYKLYCVTITEPVVEGSGVSDGSGSVTVILKAKNPIFGCNIQDANNKGAASLFFNSGSNQSQTITGSGDINLGTITTITADGVANSNIPANASLVTTTPPGVPCPVGTWSGVVGKSCDDSDQVVTVRVAKSALNQYFLDFTVGGMVGPSCGPLSRSNVSATYSTGTLSSYIDAFFSNDTNPPAPPGTCWIDINFGMSIDADCKTAAITNAMHGCASCDTDGSCLGCGTVTCNKPFTMTRQ